MRSTKQRACIVQMLRQVAVTATLIASQIELEGVTGVAIDIPVAERLAEIAEETGSEALRDLDHGADAVGGAEWVLAAGIRQLLDDHDAGHIDGLLYEALAGPARPSYWLVGHYTGEDISGPYRTVDEAVDAAIDYDIECYPDRGGTVVGGYEVWRRSPGQVDEIASTVGSIID